VHAEDHDARFRPAFDHLRGGLDSVEQGHGDVHDDDVGRGVVGDTDGLARLLKRVESDKHFYRELKTRGARLKPLVDPKRERAAWKALVAELS